MAKKSTDSVREFAGRYERRIAELERLWHAFENEVAAQLVEIAERDKRIAELESKFAAECQHAREGWENYALTLEKVANLEIELETARAERTCRNIAESDEMSSDPFTCSECGARGPYGEGVYHIGKCEKKEDGSVAFWDAWPVYKYCPNCGRKVMP